MRPVFEHNRVQKALYEKKQSPGHLDLGANRTFDRNAPLAEIIAVTPTKSGVDAVLGAVRGAVDRSEILSVLRKDGGDEVCRGHVGARHKGGS